MSTSVDRIAAGTTWMWTANLSVEELDALMCARPDLWEPWLRKYPAPSATCNFQQLAEVCQLEQVISG